MGDMAEYFNAMKEHNKKVAIKKKNKYIPLLEKIGATNKVGEIWEYGADWFCYPTKGFAMHKKTYKKVNLDNFIKMNSYDDCLKVSDNDYDMYI